MFVELELDGKEVFNASDGEPEDNSLCRNFSAVLGLPKLLKLAHEAGKRGEEFNVETVKVEGWPD